MTNAAKLAVLSPARIMIVGYPGSGKTGSVCSLLNAGLKVRMIDFDGNTEPLLRFTKPEMLENLDIISVADKMRNGANGIEPVGVPTAFVDAWKSLDKWKSVDPETGEETDLGASKDWGPDTVVLLDSLTRMGTASLRRVSSMLNRTPLNFRDSDWKIAMDEQEALIERLTSKKNKFHVIVTAHLRMIGPKDARKGDSDMTIKLKEAAATLVSTRLFPSALGQVLPPLIGGYFPTLLEATASIKGNKARRVLRTVPREELDLKIPAPDFPAEVPVEDGLVTVFNAITGGITKCLETMKTS